MKLRIVSLVLSLSFPFLCLAMSPGEKTAFKAQLKTARTSQEMEQVIQARLGNFPMDKLLERGWRWGFTYELYQISEDFSVPLQVLLQAISPIIEDCIFEELYVLLSRQADDVVSANDSVNIWLEKYRWTDKSALHPTIRFTAEIKKFLQHYPDGPPAPTDPNDRFSSMQQNQRDEFLETKTRMLQCGNPEYIQSRERQNTFVVTKLKNYWFVVIGGLAMSAVLGGIYYWCFAKSEKQEQQNDTGVEADQEVIKNDVAQNASVNIK